MDKYGLTPLQAGMLFNYLKDPSLGVDIEQITVDLLEKVDADTLQRAWNDVIAAHPALRTVFVWEGVAQPLQVVWGEAPIAIARHDWCDLDDPERAFADYLLEQRTNGFDLAAAPPLKVDLFRLGAGRYRMLWCFHHILMDGRSFGMILRQVENRYASLMRGADDPVEPGLPFRRYVEWFESLDLSNGLAFWKERLANFTGPTPLPVDPEPPRGHAPRYGEEHLRLTKELTDRLRAVASELDATLNAIVMSAWAVLLHKHSGLDEIVFGTTKTSRRSSIPNADSIVGLFLNTLPMRARVHPNMPARDVIKAVREQWLTAREYEFTPLVEIKNAVGFSSPEPLFDSMVVFENRPFQEELRDFGGVWADRRCSLYEEMDSTLGLLAYGVEEMRLKLDYNARKYRAGFAQGLLKQIEQILASIAADPGASIASVRTLSQAEARRITIEWNRTEREYPRDRCVHELIAEQARQNPERVAVVFGGRSVTYGEANTQANRLAHYLRRQGVGADSLVGVEVERSERLPIALLAVLKAGGGYVPLDPIYPPERRRFMAEDAGLTVLVTDAFLEERAAEIAAESAADPEPLARPDNLAYVIYTSGSTGKPKGVEIPHRALTNFLCAFRNEPGMSAADTLLAVTTISFDIAGLEMYLPLLCGGRIAIASREDAMDAAKLQELVDAHGVTALQATPATFRMLVDAGWRGRPGLKILCGGEAMPKELAAELLARCGELWNVYGPTETTIWSVVERITEAEQPILIGRPIANTDVYVVDGAGNPVPPGMAGELLIGGDGVARGYRNRPELTAEKFIEPRFETAFPGRVYRTGDLARYRDDGRLECLGRLDFQVKIRGFRIELGEIESALKARADVAQAVVTAREDQPGDKRLIAYVIPAAGSKFDWEKARHELRATLPEYMVPSDCVLMDEFPLTPNNKVDRRALPPPGKRELQASGTPYAAPRTPLEMQLTKIFAEALGLPRVGIHDNFFEIGGHSLLAVKVFAKCLEYYPNVKPMLATLLQNPTVAQFAEAIGNDAAPTGIVIRMREGDPGRLPLFLIPGAGGNVLSLRSLSVALPRELPLYCLQAKGLDGSEPFRTVQETALHYIEEIQKVQAHGPYALGGFCYGGLIAYEMARELTARGETVDLLALVDAVNGATERALPKSVVVAGYAGYLTRRLVHHLRELKGQSPKEMVSYAAIRAVALTRRARSVAATVLGMKANTSRVTVADQPELKAAGSRMVETLNRVREASIIAANGFVPEPYPGSALVLRAQHRQEEIFRDDSLGWRSVVKGGVDCRVVAGEHLSMNQDDVAALLTQAMGRRAPAPESAVVAPA